MTFIPPRCRCGHNWAGHRIPRPHPCKTCGCNTWRRDFDRERRIRNGDQPPTA